MIHPKQLVELPQQPKLNEEDINTFEIEHNVVFPDDYKQFMLTYNGANFGGNSFVCLNGMNLAMKTIYGLGISGYNDLNKRYGDQDCPKAYLKGILCIGQDACGSKIMLGMRGGDLGCVYFFEYESFLRPTTGFFKIANSFSELINGLVADE